MRTNTQTQWITEAEARCLGDAALSQRARLEPPIGVVWSEPRAPWSGLLPKLMSRLCLAISRDQGGRWSIYEGAHKRDLIVKPQRSRRKA